MTEAQVLKFAMYLPVVLKKQVPRIQAEVNARIEREWENRIRVEIDDLRRHKTLQEIRGKDV